MTDDDAREYREQRLRAATGGIVSGHVRAADGSDSIPVRLERGYIIPAAEGERLTKLYGKDLLEALNSGPRLTTELRPENPDATS